MKYMKMFSDLSLGKIVILSVFVAAGYYFTYFDPGASIEEEIEKIKSEVASLESKKVEINSLMKREEEMRGSILQLSRNLDVVKARIPNELKDSQMQSIINEAATNAGASVSSLAMANTDAKNQSTAPIKIKSSDIKPENLIEEVKFKISLTATFDSFLKFLDSLAKEDKVIKIKNFRIDKASQSVDEDKILFEGEIVGFKQANFEIIPGDR